MVGISKNVPNKTIHVREEIPFEKEDAGRLIGARGSTVRQLQDDSGASIKIDADAGVVAVSGLPAAVASARQAIYSILGGKGAVTIWGIDEAAIGFITRQNWLSEIQAEHGVEVSIERKCLRIKPFNEDIGLASQVKIIIAEKIQEESELVEEKISCPPEEVQKINSDAGLLQLRDTSGLTMGIRKDDSGTYIHLSGIKGVVTEARECIEAIVNLGKSRDFVPIIADLLSDISSKKLSDLLEDINTHAALPYCTRVELYPGSTKAVITGNADAVPQAKKKVQEILQYYFSSNCTFVQLHPGAVEYICGPEDRYLIRAQSRDLQVSMDKEACRLWTCGKPRQLEIYCDRIERELDKWHSTNKEMYLDDGCVVGWIVGPRGDNIRKLQAETNCTISVDDLTVKIQAENLETLEKGERAVQAIIHSYNSRCHDNMPGSGAYGRGRGRVQANTPNGRVHEGGQTVQRQGGRGGGGNPYRPQPAAYGRAWESTKINRQW